MVHYAQGRPQVSAIPACDDWAADGGVATGAGSPANRRRSLPRSLNMPRPTRGLGGTELRLACIP